MGAKVRQSNKDGYDGGGGQGLRQRCLDRLAHMQVLLR